MRIDLKKLELCLAMACMPKSKLRKTVSPQVLTKINKGMDVMPKTVGKIAKALGVPVTDII